MTPSWHEAPVSLDKLDAHLKALLRLKIREFVHLSPWFKDTPTVDPALFTPVAEAPRMTPLSRKPEDCPNRKHDNRAARRHSRAAAHLTRAI